MMMISVSVSDQQPTMGSTQQEAGHEMEQKKISKTFRQYLPDCHRTYSCVHCRAHLANHDELISKSFQGSQGRAYLFNSVVNVGCGPAEERVLLTGRPLHLQPGVGVNSLHLQDSTPWLTSSVIAARQLSAGSTNTLSSPVRSTRRGSSS